MKHALFLLPLLSVLFGHQAMAVSPLSPQEELDFITTYVRYKGPSTRYSGSGFQDVVCTRDTVIRNKFRCLVTASTGDMKMVPVTLEYKTVFEDGLAIPMPTANLGIAVRLTHEPRTIRLARAVAEITSATAGSKASTEITPLIPYSDLVGRSLVESNSLRGLLLIQAQSLMLTGSEDERRIFSHAFTRHLMDKADPELVIGWLKLGPVSGPSFRSFYLDMNHAKLRQLIAALQSSEATQITTIRKLVVKGATLNRPFRRFVHRHGFEDQSLGRRVAEAVAWGRMLPQFIREELAHAWSVAHADLEYDFCEELLRTIP